MKGVVFTEFLEMVEDRFSPDVADEIIESCDLECGGAYTAVGTYDHHELLQLVQELSKRSGIAVPDLVRSFGEHLFGRFALNYGKFFEGVQSSFEFLGSVQDYIHVEVLKLYPDAELPEFESERTGENSMKLTYRSQRPFADLAEGLICGCAKYFGESVRIEREVLPDGRSVRFSVTKR